jgi:hypothetical protein
MNLLRWLLFIPVATVLAVACGFGIGGLLPLRSFNQNHIVLSIVSPSGLAPEILERLLPVTLFILLGAMIAPSMGRKVTIMLGILGGIFGWPFGPRYSLEYGHIFYAASAAGTLIGCALGMLLAFQWQAARRAKQAQPGARANGFDKLTTGDADRC